MLKREPLAADTPQHLLRGQLIEIVGLAGSGKSTLGQLILNHWNDARPARRLRLKDVRYLPYCTRHIARLLPRLRQLRADGKPASKEEIKKMIYLQGWHHVLERQKKTGHALLMDQGPIFNLATLHGFGPPSLRTGHDDWWQASYDLWASRIDAVVWLDAPFETLRSRISRRPTPHDIKDAPADVADRYLSAYRDAYSHVVSALSQRRRIRLLKFDTSRQSAASIASQLLQK